jgi:phosphoribosylformimino-5-aminoimidazole carboxamide ribotide isomerase
VTAIDRDGLLQGPDLDLYNRLITLDRGSTIASGGIATLDDLVSIRAMGCIGAIVGRAIYEGGLDLAGVIAAQDRRPTARRES